MVLDKDLQKDVFADFHIQESVRDNEARLSQREKDVTLATSAHVDESVFEEFNLNKIVRKQQERLEKEEVEKKAREDGEEMESLRDTSSRRGKSSIRGLGLFLRPSPMQRATSSGSDDNYRHSSDRQYHSKRNEHHSSRQERSSSIRERARDLLALGLSKTHRGGTEDSEDDHHRHSSRQEDNSIHQENWETDSNIGIGEDGGSILTTMNHKDPNPFISKRRKKHTNTSRSGTTITTSIIEEDDEYYDYEDEDIASLGDTDLEEGENEDDDDSYIGAPSPRRKRKARVITRSSTGMPIGGMINKDMSGNAHNADYSWVSPHSADTIFCQFDIDAIIKEYEQLDRKINYGPNLNENKELDGIEEEGNEHMIGIKVRYQNFLTWWMDNFPRTHFLLCFVLVPMFLIIGFTIGIGWKLAEYEYPQEVIKNDQIMQSRYYLDLSMNTSSAERLKSMYQLPTLCFDHYMAQKITTDRPTNSTSNGIISAETYGSMDIAKSDNEFNLQDFSPVSPEFNSDINVTIGEIESYLNVCKSAAKGIIDKHINFERQLDDTSSMTFNWMRCWNTDKLGDVNPWLPDKDQLRASGDQEDFYSTSWNLNQTSLYENFSKGCTNPTCRKEAVERSVNQATGAAMCNVNQGASAWFWFVVMTTVGYGNVSPVTAEGRWLVFGVGWISIIVWAILLYVAGRVVGIIIDDLFRKFNLRRLTENLPSVMVWLAVSVAWVVFVGEHYVWWYNATEHPDYFRFTPFGLRRGGSEQLAEISIEDAYWFSYISLLTVGLGDFSIAPESFFLSDLFAWTLSFLMGFTLISTFLGQVADLANSLFPDSGMKLKERLLNTTLVGRKEVMYKKENEKGIEKLEKLVEIMDEDDKELLNQRVTRIRVKKNLLVQMLHQTKIELEHYKKQGERYDSLSYNRVCQEENMLSEVFTNTQKERMKLEAYRYGRSGSDGSALPTAGTKDAYFDDGTTQEQVSAKLKLRTGQKSTRKRLKASWYI